MGRNLLCKLKAQITFDSDGLAGLKLRGPLAKTLIVAVAQEEEWWLFAAEGRPLDIPELPFKFPGVWTEDNLPGLAQNVPPIVVELKPRSSDRLLKYGILQPCQSSWNTPLLSVQTGD
jgi:hypothetical protein